MIKHTYLAQETPWSRRGFSQSEALPLHSGLADLCDHPKCGWFGCIISVSGGLRSRYPLKKLIRNDEIKFQLAHSYSLSPAQSTTSIIPGHYLVIPCFSSSLICMGDVLDVLWTKTGLPRSWKYHGIWNLKFSGKVIMNSQLVGTNICIDNWKVLSNRPRVLPTKRHPIIT